MRALVGQGSIGSRPSAVLVLFAVGCGGGGPLPGGPLFGDGGSAGAGGAPDSGPHELLSETGLYADLARSEELAEGVASYRPRFELWADGAEKRRFVWLPPGAAIETSDMDHWTFPVGTRFWKEFRRDGVRVETRLLEKTAETEWHMLAYVWSDDDTDARLAPRGASDARGTGHDVPSGVMCGECHHNVPDKVLGFDAVQLSHSAGGLTLADLAREGRLTEEPVDLVVLPGDEVAQAALGYLHANCGNCHNPRSGIFPTVRQELRLEVGSLGSVEDTTVYRSTVGVPLQGVPPSEDTPALRIQPGRPEGSAVHHRMASRDSLVQMPPLSTEVPDGDGLEAVGAWIQALEP